jgi:hypothetical protein
LNATGVVAESLQRRWIALECVEEDLVKPDFNRAHLDLAPVLAAREDITRAIERLRAAVKRPSTE